MLSNQMHGRYPSSLASASQQLFEVLLTACVETLYEAGFQWCFHDFMTIQAHNSPLYKTVMLLSEILIKKLTNLAKGLFGLGRVDVPIVLRV